MCGVTCLCIQIVQTSYKSVLLVHRYAKGPEQWRNRESSKQGTREAYANIFQADGKEDVPNTEPDFEGVPPASDGKKKRKSVEEEIIHNNDKSVVVSEPPSISALQLDGTMAKLGFNISKFPHSNKKKKVAAQQPELSFFEPEEGAVVKKDEIDALFKEKKGDKSKKEKQGEKSIEKKGRKRNKQEERGIKRVVEPEAVKVESAAVVDSLKAVMGVLEGGLRKGKKKKGDGSGKQKTQNIMI